MNRLRLTGLVAAPHTPFTADGDLLLTTVDLQAQILAEGRISAAFVCGTTGEGLSLSTPERMQLLERWIQVAPKSFPVIAHVGHTSVVEARALAAHAQRAGAAAFSILAPCFFKPATLDALLDFSSRVAAAAPGLPFYYYHLPSLTGVTFSMTEYFTRAVERIPNFTGIKFTHNDVPEYQQLLTLAGDTHNILFGRDELYLSGLAAGATGAIGSTYNYAAPAFHRISAAFNSGDHATAAAAQAEVMKLIGTLRRYGEIAVAKAVLTMCGVPCGPVRTPLTNLTADQFNAVRTELEPLDIFTRPLGR